ncbi:hypothetical protein CTAYLR_008810 [Chrysophaeum taylorii]|uniref:peptidylprolyl isomerase n=1 Tax=Chrysophaeum taylorii TaxID=2483200 RepID=A0AAD7UE84_9STRA|nr:hypothetical protein CTAYLR_008810 [Chrysophaeum taylorii]
MLKKNLFFFFFFVVVVVSAAAAAAGDLFFVVGPGVRRLLPRQRRRAPLLLLRAVEEYEATASGLKFRDDIEGSGDQPKKGDVVVVDYVGSLSSSGSEFDSSYARGAPFSFPLGEGRVIAGWDEGLATMRVGGKRTLLIPPHLAYGDRDVGGGRIPPNSELKFVVELKDVKSGPLAQVAMTADNTVQNVIGNFGLNPFTFFVVLFLLLTVVPVFLPDDSPLMYGDFPNPFAATTATTTSSLDAEMTRELSAL